MPTSLHTVKHHNKLWFKNRIGKKVYCTDHDDGCSECEGIEIESEIVMNNLLLSQAHGVRFHD